MSTRSAQAHHLAQALSAAHGVRFEAVYDSGAWRIDWADGPLDSDVRAQVAAAVAGPDYPLLRDRKLNLYRGNTARAWAARAIAAHRDGTLTEGLKAGTVYRHERPSWSDLTDEDLAILRFVEQQVQDTAYPERASDPADEPLITQLLESSKNRGESEMARTLLNDPTFAEGTRNRKMLPTWDEIAANAIEELNTSRRGLSDARDWLKSDWRGVGPIVPGKRAEAMRLIGEAKAALDQAKTALAESAGQ